MAREAIFADITMSKDALASNSLGLSDLETFNLRCKGYIDGFDEIARRMQAEIQQKMYSDYAENYNEMGAQMAIPQE